MFLSNSSSCTIFQNYFGNSTPGKQPKHICHYSKHFIIPHFLNFHCEMQGERKSWKGKNNNFSHLFFSDFCVSCPVKEPYSSSLPSLPRSVSSPLGAQISTLVSGLSTLASSPKQPKTVSTFNTGLCFHCPVQQIITLCNNKDLDNILENNFAFLTYFVLVHLCISPTNLHTTHLLCKVWKVLFPSQTENFVLSERSKPEALEVQVQFLLVINTSYYLSEG